MRSLLTIQSQQDLAIIPNKQIDTQQILQTLDLLANCRLGQAQNLCSASKTAQLSDFDKAAQRLNIQIDSHGTPRQVDEYPKSAIYLTRE